MELAIKLDRPLVFLDLEATGSNPRSDRIVEIAMVKVMPDGAELTFDKRVNPLIPIPPEASAVHGIRDQDVRDCPTFDAIAAQAAQFMRDCDFAGFTVIHYDLPLLVEEFMRARVAFDPNAARVVDVQRIFHKREPRTLAAAMEFYRGEKHSEAHDAMGDTLATMRVFEAQLKRYPDLPRTVEDLDAYCNPRDPTWADRTGRIKWVAGEMTINFGKHRGKVIRTLVKEDPGFLKWIVKSDFPRDTRELVQGALENRFPPPPPAQPAT